MGLETSLGEIDVDWEVGMAAHKLCIKVLSCEKNTTQQKLLLISLLDILGVFQILNISEIIFTSDQPVSYAARGATLRSQASKCSECTSLIHVILKETTFSGACHVSDDVIKTLFSPYIIPVTTL